MSVFSPVPWAMCTSTLASGSQLCGDWQATRRCLTTGVGRLTLTYKTLTRAHGTAMKRKTQAVTSICNCEVTFRTQGVNAQRAVVSVSHFSVCQSVPRTSLCQALRLGTRLIEKRDDTRNMNRAHQERTKRTIEICNWRKKNHQKKKNNTMILLEDPILRRNEEKSERSV